MPATTAGPTTRPAPPHGPRDPRGPRHPARPSVTLAEFRATLDEWLEEHQAALAPAHAGTGTLDQQMAQLAKVKSMTYDAGWMRLGWPERVGGRGGSTLLRAYLGEALTSRDLVEPGLYSMTEVLAPTMIDYAPSELAAAMVPALLRGAETWCQGFSEPGTGSNLASLSCRAVRTGDGWRVRGQKVWTSLAQYAQRCILFTRTGAPESAHAGITALFVDMDRPGITVRPITALHGRDEFCEVFFDDVAVPPSAPWAGRATAGPWPWTSCPTSAAPRCGTGPPSCTGACRTWWGRRRWARSTRPDWAR